LNKEEEEKEEEEVVEEEEEEQRPWRSVRRWQQCGSVRVVRGEK